MDRGEVLAIYIAPSAAAPLISAVSVEAIPGRGLVGDRYYNGTGTWSGWPDHEITLIEWEAIEEIRREYGIDLSPGDARRNVVTRGVPLMELVGRRFRVGSLPILGVRSCDPCRHIESLTQPGVLKALTGRGGLRGRILERGILRVGSCVEVEDW